MPPVDVFGGCLWLCMGFGLKSLGASNWRLFACFATEVAICYLSWHLRVAPSAAIVLTMTALFLLAFFFAPGKGYLWSLLGRSARTA